MRTTLDKYNMLSKYPGGKTLFGFLVALSAPFFSKIRPKFIKLKPAYCETQIKDRRPVRNHLGSINAGALCTMAELTGGLALDTAIPEDMRWIPKGMEVKYIAKATGTITAVSEFDQNIIEQGNIVIPVTIKNSSGKTIFTAKITFYISLKKKRPI